MRDPTEYELYCIFALLRLGGYEEFFDQLVGLKVRDILEDADNYGSIKLFTAGTPVDGSDSIPIDAVADDVSGLPIEISLHIRHGVLEELEFVKLDASPIIRRPDPSAFTLQSHDPALEIERDG